MVCGLVGQVLCVQLQLVLGKRQQLLHPGGVGSWLAGHDVDAVVGDQAQHSAAVILNGIFVVDVDDSVVHLWLWSVRNAHMNGGVFWDRSYGR